MSTVIFCTKWTDFVGATNHPQNLRKFLYDNSTEDTISTYFATDIARFHFISPRVVHIDAVCEAAVKSEHSPSAVPHQSRLDNQRSKRAPRNTLLYLVAAQLKRWDIAQLNIRNAASATTWNAESWIDYHWKRWIDPNNGPLDNTECTKPKL